MPVLTDLCPPDVTLRPLDDSLLDLCVDLFIDTFSAAPWYDTYDSRQQVVDFFRHHMQNNYYLGYALMRGGAPLALSIGMKKPWIDGMEYYIDEFCVRRDAQGRGIGSLFLRLIEQDIAARGLNAMILCTERGFPSEKFYLKNGFKPLDDTVFLAK